MSLEDLLDVFERDGIQLELYFYPGLRFYSDALCWYARCLPASGFRFWAEGHTPYDAVRRLRDKYEREYLYLPSTMTPGDGCG
jgi:hypothetical protein